MNQVTVPVRFPKEEYKRYRKIALDQGKSFAQLVRDSMKAHKAGGVDMELIKRRKAAAKRLWENRIPIDVPIKDLIREGRRFDDDNDYRS